MLLTLATPAEVMAFSISFRFKASFKGVRACICFLDDTFHFIPPKSVIIQIMESHRKMLLSLSFARPNPKTKTTNTKGMTNIENSLMQDPHLQHYDLTANCLAASSLSFAPPHFVRSLQLSIPSTAFACNFDPSFRMVLLAI